MKNNVYTPYRKNQMLYPPTNKVGSEDIEELEEWGFDE
jgi:hypothetical protein